MNQDLITIAFEHNLNKIYKQLNNITAKKITLFSSNASSFSNKNKSDVTLYNKIRQNMFSHEKATAYFINQIDKTILSDTIYKENTQYYIGNSTSWIFSNDITIKETNKDFNEYCQAYFISLATQSWSNFIDEITDKFPDAKTLNDILESIDLNTLSNMLEAFKKDLLKDLDNMKDSEYFTQNVLHLAKNNIDSIFNNLKTNIIKAQDKQYVQKFIRAMTITLVGIVDLDIKDIFKNTIKKIVTIIDMLWTGTNEIIDIIESSDKVMNYSIGSLLITLFTSQIAPIIYLCKKHFMNELLFYDSNFIDFTIYSYMIETSLPIQSTFIKGAVNDNFIDRLPHILNEKESYNNTSFEYSIININDKNYNLEQHILRNIQNLKFFFFAEYTDINSANFIEIMKQKAQQEKNTSSYKEKIYLFITEAPSILNAGLTKDIINMIGLTPDGYIKHKKRQEALEKKHDPIIDYSNYTIKQNIQEFKHIVLQLSPFIKIPDDLATEYKTYINDRWFYIQNSINKIKRNINSTIKEQNNYIDSFFQTQEDVEEIIQKEEEFAKEFLQLTQTFFDSINKNKTYHSKQSSGKVIKENTQYSSQEILSIIITLCILKNDFNNIEPILGETGRTSLIKSLFSEIEWFQTYTIVDYGFLYILTKNAHIISDDTKIYIFLSQKAKDNAIKNTNMQTLRVDIIVDEILQTKNKTQDNFYTNAFNTFTKHINELSLENTQKQEIQSLQTKEQEMLVNIRKNTKNMDTEMIRNQINKVSIQKIINESIKSYIPFASYFNDNPDLLGKLIHYIAEYIFSEKNQSKSFHKGFAYILTKELGIMGILKYDKTKIKYEVITKTYEFYIAIMNARILYMKQAIHIEKEMKITTKNSLRIVSKIELINLLKDGTKETISSAAQSFLTNWIKKTFPNYYEEFKSQYEYIYYKNFRYKYNAPYAVNRKEFVIIPMKIYNAYMGFDLHTMIYGSKLCTGGLKYHSGIAYSYTPKSSTLNTAITKDYVIQKILGYILLDELRGVSNNTSYYIDDMEFFSNGFNKANLNILQTKKHLYKLTDSNKLEEFNKIESENDKNATSAIEAYNACIDILSDIYNDNINTQTKDNTYKAKIMQLAQYLKIIGQNNIKAMYMGIKHKDDAEIQKKRPKFIGRLATTIIMEDGLWLG